MDSRELEFRLRIEEAASAFEAVWRSGRRPSIEAWAARFPELDAKTLCDELALVRDELLADDSHIEIGFAAQTKIDFEQASDDRIVGHYRLGERIGLGQMGEVYIAEDMKLGRSVALKLMRGRFAESETLAKRFENEARLAASLQHPNIVTVYEFGHGDGIWFLAMPLLSGGTLLNPEAGDWQPREFIQAIASVAFALDHAHQHNVIHRDVKPANIMLDRNRAPVVVDFGLARLTDRSQLTLTSEVLGTPAYLSPEQAAGRRDLGPSTDIYSLGVILYQFLCERLPFERGSAAEVLRDIETKNPKPIREVCPDIDLALDTITMKCLCKRPADRYTSAFDLGRDLQRYLDGIPIRAKPVSPAAKLVAKVRRQPNWLAGVGVVAVFLICLLGINYVNTRAEYLDPNSSVETRSSEAKIRLAQSEAQRWRDEARLTKQDADFQTQLSIDREVAQALTAASAALSERSLSSIRLATRKISQVDGMQGIDSEYFHRAVSRARPTIVSHFSASGDLQLCDATLSPDGQLIATGDRSGLIEVRSVYSGELVCRPCVGRWDKPTARYMAANSAARARVSDDTGLSERLFRSLAWLDANSLVAGSVDGALVRFRIPDGNASLIKQFDRELRLVRVDHETGQIAVVDSEGTLTLIRSDAGDSFATELAAEVRTIRRVIGWPGWIVADAAGTVLLLNNHLHRVSQRQCDGSVNDLVATAKDDRIEVFVACQQLPIQHFSLDTSVDEFVGLEKHGILDRKSRSPDCDYRQLEFDHAKNRLFAFDSEGIVTIWNTITRRLEVDFNLSFPQHSIQPALGVSDDVTRRSGSVLFVSAGRLLTVDHLGVTKILDIDCLNSSPDSWNVLAIKLGPSPQLAADPSHTNNYWALDGQGTLSLIDFADASIVDEVDDAHGGANEPDQSNHDLSPIAERFVATIGNDRWLRIWKKERNTIRLACEWAHKRPLIGFAVDDGDNESRLAVLDELGKVLLLRFVPNERGDLRLVSLNSDTGPTLSPVGSIDLNFAPPEKTRISFTASERHLAIYDGRQYFARLDRTNMEVKEGISEAIGATHATAIALSPLLDQSILLAGPTATQQRSQVRVAGFERAWSLTVADESDGYVDFCPSDDRRRLLAVNTSGQVSVLTSGQFVRTAVFSSPVYQTCSLAVESGDRSIAVASSRGVLAWCQIDATKPSERERVDRRPQTIECRGVVNRIVTEQDHKSLRCGVSRLLEFPRDDRGSLSATFMDVTSEDRLAGQPYWLHKNGGRWSFDPVHQAGSGDEDVIDCRIQFDPKREPLILVRERGSQQNCRLSLIRPNEGNSNVPRWTHEVGHAGVMPYAIFDSECQVAEIVHFDWKSNALVTSEHVGPADRWQNRTLKGFAGYYLQGVRESNGDHNFLMRRMRGSSDAAPRMLLRRTMDGDEWTDVPGHYLFVDGNDQLYAFDQTSNEFLRRVADGRWKVFTRAPTRNLHRYRSVPHVDRDGRIWCCDNLHDRIQAYCFDGKMWRQFGIRLDESTDGTVTSCSMTTDGRLQVLSFRPGNNGILDVIEAVAESTQ